MRESEGIMNKETVEILKTLVGAYVELNKLSAQPGDRSHKLWNSTEFLEKQIKAIVKGYYEAQ